MSETCNSQATAERFKYLLFLHLFANVVHYNGSNIFCKEFLWGGEFPDVRKVIRGFNSFFPRSVDIGW